MTVPYNQHKILSVILCVMVLTAVFPGLIFLTGCESSSPEASQNQAEEVWNRIIPEAGAETEYGIPLSLDNTQQFIDWHYSIKLSEEQQKAKDAALEALPATCCDEYSMASC